MGGPRHKPGVHSDPLVGTQIGHLKVMTRLPDRKSGARNIRAQMLVNCSCGKRFQIARYYLVRKPNPRTHCGHLDREVTSYKFNPEYRVWKQMKERCYNEKHRSYPSYGGRGIRVCTVWLNSFEDFLRDMGPRPSPEMTLDRKNPNGHYEKNNCRWATPEEQANNKRPKGDKGVLAPLPA